MKCKNCKNLYNLSDENDVIVGKWCPKVGDSPDPEYERECKYYKTMSEGDRIRSMTDEELAVLFCNTGWMMKDHDKCLDWLQSKVKE